MTFYDNHDMARMKASEDGFIDAHNWLFTSRGIPVVYYGSEVAFMAGDREHEGNRNYFGPQGITAARDSRIRRALAQVAPASAASHLRCSAACSSTSILAATGRPSSACTRRTA